MTHIRWNLLLKNRFYATFETFASYDWEGGEELDYTENKNPRIARRKMLSGDLLLSFKIFFCVNGLSMARVDGNGLALPDNLQAVEHGPFVFINERRGGAEDVHHGVANNKIRLIHQNAKGALRMTF